MFTPHEDAVKRLWFLRDHLAMARAGGWGDVAPFYVDLESPMPASGLPKPGPLQVHLKDDHLQYAITWFGLALALRPLSASGFSVSGGVDRAETAVGFLVKPCTSRYGAT